MKLFYDGIIGEVKSNIPFFAQCFQEVMDKVVLDAKTEIDNALLHAVVSAGIRVLGIKEYEQGNSPTNNSKTIVGNSQARAFLESDSKSQSDEAEG